MKLLIILFVATFLAGISIETEGKMCLLTDRQTTTVKALANREGAVLSKNGRYLLYEEKTGRQSRR